MGAQGALSRDRAVAPCATFLESSSCIDCGWDSLVEGWEPFIFLASVSICKPFLPLSNTLLEFGMEGKVINNAFYDELGQKWYEAEDHPIALLRAENHARIPWVEATIGKVFQGKACKVLDIGCGAGHLANHLASKKHLVSGIDLSENSLALARERDVTKSVKYLYSNAYTLPFEDHAFDVVCAMDLLEHVEEPERVIAEASRVLKPGGIFFFHTFNRTLMGWLFAVKGVVWFVKNAPKNLHIFRLFIRPLELQKMLDRKQLIMKEMRGLAPVYNKALLKMLLSRKVGSGVAFRLTKNLSCGYLGYAQKGAVILPVPLPVCVPVPE